MSKFARVNLESNSPLDIVFQVDEDSGGEPTSCVETRKYFLPQDSNVKTVRELVIDTQSKRKARVSSRFVERMEDNLVKWKPPVSSNRGTTLAVEGAHPYQREVQSVTGAVNSERLAGKFFDSFTQWWKENARGILEARRQQVEDEFYSFTDFQDIDRVVEVTVAPTIPEEELTDGDNYNYNDALFRQFMSLDREQPLDMDAMFSSGSSLAASSQGTFLAGPAIRTPPRIALKEKQKKKKKEEVYRRSYNRPIPPTYLPQSPQQQSPALSGAPQQDLCNWTSWWTVLKECMI